MKFIFIDTETSGFDSKKNALIQVGGIVDIDGEIKEEFNFKLRPYGGEEWLESAYETNHISQEMAETFDDPSECFTNFKGILDKYINRYDKQDKAFFTAYNANFDTDFVRAWFVKEATTARDAQFGNGFGNYFWVPSLDVMQVALIRTLKSRDQFQNFQLGTVCQMLGVEFNPEDAHDALYDIRKTRELFYALKKK